MKSIPLRRALLAALIGLFLGALITEVPFLFLRETARVPMEVLLVIPKGTSEQVARGEQPPSIPKTMKFVVGDTLVVKNEDVCGSHSRPAMDSREFLGESSSRLERKSCV